MVHNSNTNMILFDCSKAFRNLERDILWAELYEEGIPIEFVQILRIGQEGNKLRPKCDGYTGKCDTDNKGGSQGIPLSATLFIICRKDDGPIQLKPHVGYCAYALLNYKKRHQWRICRAQYQYRLYQNTNPNRSISKTQIRIRQTYCNSERRHGIRARPIYYC